MFSLGLSLLQLALFSTCQGIKDLRTDEETLKRSIYLDCGVRGYSDPLKCLLLIMLRWRSAERPDFIQLEQIAKDLFRMEDNGCKALLKRLSQSTSSMLRKSTSMIPSKGSLGGGGDMIADIYSNLYQDVDQFLKIKR